MAVIVGESIPPRHYLGDVIPPGFTTPPGAQRSIGGLGDIFDVTSAEDAELGAAMGEAAADAGGWGGWFRDVFSPQNVQTVLTATQAFQLNQINLERARRNQAPLSPAQYAPRVNVGIAPETQKMLVIGGIALVALLLLPKLMDGKK